jgi:hypothetical protein
MALTPSKLEQAEFSRVLFSVTPELGTTIKEVLDPTYWRHVAGKLRPRCRIEVLAEDLSYYAELLVLSCDKTWANVALLSHVVLIAEEAKKSDKKEGEDDPFSTELHYVDYVQGASKGRVILKEGNKVVKDGFNSKKLAAEWMRAHEAEMKKQQAQSEAALME